ncbi:MAG: stage 0 sporulation family protein [Bullifex sp.]
MAKKERKAAEEAYVYVVKNPSYNDICLAAWDSVLYPGTAVVYETRFGLDLGFVVGPAPGEHSSYTPGSTCVRGACINFGSTDETGEEEVNDDPGVHQCEYCMGCQVHKEPRKVRVTGDVLFLDHLATPAEMARYNENTSKEDDAIIVCREKILKHSLNMKLITAHFLLGEPKVIFFFTADERVDFRDLVKDLVSVFKMRIELRQIGVRDESRLIGGLSVCGRDYCCHAITDRLEPVSIKMAKEQNLSLNSMKISGPCGRLLCCLAYEYDYYVEEKASMPAEGSRIKINHELYKVSEVNILSRKITLSGADGRVLYLPFDEVYWDDESEHWQVTQEWEDEIFSS